MTRERKKTEKRNRFQMDTKPLNLMLGWGFAVAGMIYAFLHSGYTSVGWGMALGFCAVAFITMGLFDKKFTTYEKHWFLIITVTASAITVLFPEENVNGHPAIWFMWLYLLDTYLNILCELLIAKQSKWNFIVSLAVEVTEITLFFLLSYRFASMAATLFFWIPIDIISFFAWKGHPDDVNEDLTEVRSLTGKQEVLVVIGIILFTAGVGYGLTCLDFGSADIFHGNETLYTVVCYADACVTAAGILNGIFILFRFKEQWYAWYLSTIGEAVINILSGQYVLLVLKVGYLTNTTYGFIKWTKYIKGKKEHEN